MSFTYLMLQIQPIVLLLIIVLLFAVIGVLTTYYFRKHINLRPKRAHNEAVGYIFAILGGFYGLLLGFVVFLVWDSLNGAQADTSREGSAAIALYRDINYYPSTEKIAPLKAAYMDYVHMVINHDFPDMEKMKPFDKHSRNALNKVFLLAGKLDMNDAYAGQLFRQLNELSLYRSLRQLDGSSSIPIEIWVPLLLGAAIILIFAILLDVESLRLHLLVNSLLGGFLGLVIFIIILLDHPFTGDMKIEPDGYNIVLRMDKEIR